MAHAEAVLKCLCLFGCAEVTVRACNCLPQYNYTVPDTGQYFEVHDGSCIRPTNGSVPWCFVDPLTCIGRPNVNPDGQAWDNCITMGEHPLL